MSAGCAACRTRGAARAALAAVSLALAACAQVAPPPVQPAPPTVAEAESDDPVQPVIATRRRLAQAAEASGDLRAALQQWQILALIAPDDPVIRERRDETQAAIGRAVGEQFRTATAALSRGETEAGIAALLHVLALQPDHPEAARHLRSIERHRIAAIQADRAARLRPDVVAVMNRAARPPRKPDVDPAGSYDLEQGLELLRTGDAGNALAELRRIVERAPAPAQKALRQRIADEAQQRAARTEAAGEREQALSLYEQAIALRGDVPPGWRSRVLALKKALAAESYEKGQRAYPTDLAQAIRHWETSLRYEPNPALELRLQEARRVYRRLQQIETEQTRR
jgi:tetratricopeptide (TPR) repeat protein